MKFELDETTKKIFQLLSNYGKTYIVGGYIRDSLLGIKTLDIDISTSLDQNQVLEILKEYKPNVLNKKYQIISFKVDNIKYEIARLRTEDGILDGRNPLHLEFCDNIELDLKRRDFTINSFAYDGEKIIDVYNAFEDLNSKIIKSIGNSKERFLEDKIRILRAFRFIGKLNFDFDENLEKTIISMSKDKELFSKISKERLIIEFNKIILSKHADKALKKMFELDILKFFIKEFDNRFDKEIFEYICNRYKKMLEKNKEINLETAYAILFSFSGKKKIGYEKFYENDSVNIFEKFNNKFFHKNTEYFIIKNLIYYHNIAFKKPSLIMLKRMLLDLVNNKNVSKLLNLMLILFPKNSMEIKKISYNIQRIYMADEPIFLSDIDLMNADLYNLGLDTKKFLAIKLSVFKAILNGYISNSKYEILNYILKKQKIHKKILFEKSSGAVVFKKVDNKYYFLIIQGSNEGSFGFPKGHIEHNEYESETAIREVKEETNIDIAIKDEEKFRECLRYTIAPNIYKEVSIFLAEAKNYNIVIDEKELSSAEWLEYTQAKNKLTFSFQREIIKKAMLYMY